MQRHTLTSVADIYTFVRRDGAGNFGKPLKRILHLLCRKGMARTVFIEENSPSQAYKHECQVYEDPAACGCRRLHFFAGARLRESGIAKRAKTYRGYCDVRPDGSLVRALIDCRVIIKPDTYTHLVCRITELVTLPGGQKLEVSGFPHIEKDHGVVMCSQAAVATVVDYWNYHRPRTFSETTPWQISHSVGKTAADLKKDNGIKDRGLTEPEIQRFFRDHYFTSHPTNFWGLTLAQRTGEDPSTEIYGHLEAGFPVIVIVGTSERVNGTPEKEDLHALTVIGHTFDKNIWTALADPLYFSLPLSGSDIADAETTPPADNGETLCKGGGGYYSNLAWIKYFIVQDDNLGPYFFLPREIIPRIVRSIIVPTPYKKIIVPAKAAERAAYVALHQFHLRLPTLAEELRPSILPANAHWLHILMDHHKEWVLRPVLTLGKVIVENHAPSEFASNVAAEFPDPDQLSWCIEISWPNLYCYEECQMGEIIIDATTKAVRLMKLPGLLILGKDQRYFARTEEPPYPHRKPSKHQQVIP